MQKNIIDQNLLNIIIQRLCQQLLENHNDFEQTVLLGIQPKGVFVAQRIARELQKITEKQISLGFLDITFFRDDFRRREKPLSANTTKIDFLIEGKKVVLIDDVLYTGRTVRAALDAMLAFGRPEIVDFLVLIDRKYTRNLPIEANYVGKAVHTLNQQRVKVELKEQGFEQDTIWLIESQES
ncbi:MAG: bifunctional pyr operon transcriptional regulator/uracil phosphoribosyltransferase PyrR [Raineya sp.]